MRIIVSALWMRELSFKGTWMLPPCPPKWIWGSHQVTVLHVYPKKPQGSSRWEDLPWDSPPSTPMLVNIIHSSPTDETLGSIAGGYSSAPSISLLPMVNCSPETNDHSLMYGQKASKSPRLHHNAYVIPLASSHHVGALSSHIITQRRVSTGP